MITNSVASDYQQRAEMIVRIEGNGVSVLGLHSLTVRKKSGGEQLMVVVQTPTIAYMQC
jgi:hypothetical protein